MKPESDNFPIWENSELENQEDEVTSAIVTMNNIVAEKPSFSQEESYEISYTQMKNLMYYARVEAKKNIVSKNREEYEKAVIRAEYIEHALFFAENGDCTYLKDLVHEYAKDQLDCAQYIDSKEKTPLHMKIGYGYLEISKMLPESYPPSQE